MAREGKRAGRGEASGKARPAARDAQGRPDAGAEDVPGSTAAQAQARPQGQQAGRKPPKKKKKVGALGWLRAIAPVAVVVVRAAAFVANVPLSSISTFGWEAISAICPVGALSMLLASRAMIPRALVSLAIAAALILVFGRAFCSWVRTVPLVQRTLGIRSASTQDLRRDRRDRERKAARRGGKGRAKAGDTSEGAHRDPVAADATPAPVAPAPAVAVAAAAGQADEPAARAPLTDEERAQIKAEMHAATGGACGAVCPEGIDLHDYTRGERGINECIKCRACVDACPTRAITLPLVPPRDRWPHSSVYGPVGGAPAETRRDSTGELGPAAEDGVAAGSAGAE